MIFFIMASRFICEIVALIIFGRWGFLQGKIVGAIGVPLVVAVIWTLFGSPKAPYKLQGFYGTVFEFFLFGVVSYILYRLGYTPFALIYFVIAFGISIFIQVMDI
ncbi:uncharacterized protein DUF2568 [Ureibacillus xyleni]|uniref:Uncharacterized protein DUF2568 n=1 Tax=Ureibacillus xyleni TaxID=614648 RepID=A0A285TGQ4_9BACL|nr:YrdB family protein [Ureibacillus xyleni]SOC19512.1 uncharacterized protein DUF2568 [Ureibacillus xyleni]